VVQDLLAAPALVVQVAVLTALMLLELELLVKETTVVLVLLAVFTVVEVEVVLAVLEEMEQQLLEVQVVLEQLHILLGITQLLLV
jgi:hypothetical protein